MSEGEATAAAEGKQVRVTVSTAKELPDMSWFGNMDPYVVVYTLPGRKHIRQTKPHNDGYNKSYNVNPEWTEDLGNVMTLPIENDTTLVLEVWDENWVFDKLLGKTETSLEPGEFVHTALSTSGDLEYKFEIIEPKKGGVWETAFGEESKAAAAAPAAEAPKNGVEAKEGEPVAEPASEADASTAEAPPAEAPAAAEAPEAASETEKAAEESVEKPAEEAAEKAAEEAAEKPAAEPAEKAAEETTGKGEEKESEELDCSKVDEEARKAANSKRILKGGRGRGRGRGRGKK